MIKFLSLKYITFFMGFISCFVMHTTFNVPLVISAALTGLIGSFIPFPKSVKNHPYAAIYAGSFAGMCSTNLIVCAYYEYVYWFWWKTWQRCLCKRCYICFS